MPHKTLSLCCIIELLKLIEPFFHASLFMIPKMHLIDMTTGHSHSLSFVSIVTAKFISGRVRSGVMSMQVLVLMVDTFRSGHVVTLKMRRLFASKLKIMFFMILLRILDK